MKVLESYQASSGQVVSPDKFEGLYSRSVPNYYEYMTCQQINIMAVTSLCRHMSPLLVFRRSKKDFFSISQRKSLESEMVEKKFLSNYIMSCYKLP